MLRRLDISQIIRDHLNTLYAADTNQRSWGDVTLFFVFPGAVALVLLWLGDVRLTPPVANEIITALAIFAGLLFNLLLLTHSLIGNSVAEKGVVKRVIREIYANISFATLIALTIILISLGSLLGQNPTFVLIVSGVVIYFLTNFLLTLLMILSRIHTLLSRDFDLK